MAKIAIIGTVGIPACYGGFETLAHKLVDELDTTHQISVYCSGKQYVKGNRPSHFKNTRLFYIPLKANGIQSIPYDMLSILHALFYADILLILGVSGALLLPFIKLFTKKKIIISIDGLEWKRDKWSTPIKMFLKFCEKLAVRFSHADITDNAAIQAYTASEYQTTSHLIEYGADHASPQPITEQIIQEYPFLQSPYYFKVCRIEPENNLDMVLEAFAEMKELSLVIIGNWKHSAYAQNLYAKYTQFENIHLLNPIYEQKKLDAIRSNAYAYIHGHSAGGTNPSLVEAMFLRLPIFCFGVSYNRATTENKALYFETKENLIQLVKSTNRKQLEALRTDMKEIAQRRYLWTLISKRYVNLIELLAIKPSKESIEPKWNALPAPLLNKLHAPHLKQSLRFFENTNA
ncbi:MAG: DUF1972 domain-containing protein [Flexibacteraceae bacterium]